MVVCFNINTSIHSILLTIQLSATSTLFPVVNCSWICCCNTTLNTLPYFPGISFSISAHLQCSDYIETEIERQSSLIACHNRIMPNIKCDHFLALFPLQLKQFVSFSLNMLTLDDHPSFLENNRVLDGMLWLQMVGFYNQVRSFLKNYLPTPRTSCFSTQGIQVDDPNSTRSYFTALKYGLVSPGQFTSLISAFILMSFT